MTVDDIYRVAGTRTNAIRLMQREGYILDRGQVTVARAPGVRTDAQILAAGRGRGTVTIGGQTATTRRASRFDAAQTGQRDPLNRATMTAAERRLYDANYRLQYARTTGNVRAVSGSAAPTSSRRRSRRPQPGWPSSSRIWRARCAGSLSAAHRSPCGVSRGSLGLI